MSKVDLNKLSDQIVMDYESKSKSVSPGPIAKFLLKPIGWPTFLIFTILCVSELISRLPPGGYFGVGFLAILSSMPLGIWVVIRFVSRAVVQFQVYRQLIADRSWWRWVWVILIGFIVFILSVSEIPLRVGFWISKGSLENFALSIQKSPPAGSVTKWCGLYKVTYQGNAAFGTGYVALHVEGSGFINPGYFIYSNTAPALPPDIPIQVDKSWWAWQMDF